MSGLRIPQLELEQAGRAVLPCSVSNLPIPQSDPLVTGQFIQSHWTSGADLIGADADFCAHPKFPAIGEPSRGIPVNRRRINIGEELPRSRFVSGYDAV